MAKESRSILEAVKEDIKRASGGGFKMMFKLREAGAKVRVRFLEDFEEGHPIVFHDKWNGFNHPCLEQYGKDCPNCNNAEGRTGTVYYWSIYNYETKQVELFGFKANKASPVQSLAAVYEELGDITSQDLVIIRNGTGMETTYTVIPTGKVVSFKKEAKPLTERKLMKLLYETYKDYGDDYEPDEDEDEEEDERPTRKVKKSTPKKRRPPVDEDEDDEDFDEDDLDDDEDEDYEPPKKKKSVAKKKKKPAYEEDEEEDDTPFDEDDEEEEDELPPPKKRRR